MGRIHGVAAVLMAAGLVTRAIASEVSDFGNEIPGIVPRLGKTQFVPQIELGGQSSAIQEFTQSATNEDDAVAWRTDLSRDEETKLGSDAFDLQLVSQEQNSETPTEADLSSDDRPESQPAPAHVRNRRVLVFKASWCGACQGLNYEWPKLRAVKWQVGDSGTDHIQIVDVDARPDLMAKYGVQSLPTIVLIENGKELRRHGLLSAYNIAELFHGRY